MRHRLQLIVATWVLVCGVTYVTAGDQAVRTRTTTGVVYILSVLGVLPVQGLTTTGNVGVGTATLASPAGVTRFLQISNATSAGLVISDATDDWEVYVNSNEFVIANEAVSFLTIEETSGFVGLGTNAAASRLVVNGNIGLTTSSTGAGTLAISATAPTVAGFAGTASILANGTLSFRITTGTADATSTGTMTVPAAATGWACWFADTTTPASYVVSQTGGTTTTVTVTNYSRTTGLAAAWLTAEVIRGGCSAY